MPSFVRRTAVRRHQRENAMIARCRILLPDRVHVKSGDALQPLVWERSNEIIRLYPPIKSTINRNDLDMDSPRPRNEVVLRLAESDPNPTSETTMIGGEPTIPADLLQIDLLRAGFDRRQSLLTGDDPRVVARRVDPPLDYVLRIANNWLARLRVASRAGTHKPLEVHRTWMLVTYLDDDESQLPQLPNLHRRIAWQPTSWSVLALDNRVWDAVNALGWEYEALPAQTILLDAFGLLPDVGPAIVLANVALEVRIAEVLDASVPSTGVGPALWKWITAREPYWQAPSTKDEFDVLLNALTGRSLKSNQDLWQAFTALRAARNSFVHGGTAKIGKGAASTVLTADRARELLVKASDIMDWLDQLPYLKRRAYKGVFPMQFTFSTHVRWPV